MWKWLKSRLFARGLDRGKGDLEQDQVLHGVSGTGGERGTRVAASSAPLEPRRDASRVTIGLDYGTHSTKVVVHQELDEHGELLVLRSPPDNSSTYHPYADAPFPWFSQPSVVGVREGQLVFGEEARHPGNTLRHFALKATLIKDEPKLDPRFIEATGCRAAPESVDVLAVGYIVWILDSVRAHLDSLHTARGWLPFVAVGAPMDHYEDSELKQRYERILNAAVRLAFGDSNRERARSWCLPEAADEIRSAMAEAQPPEGHRLYAVLPETVAAMVPLSRDPRWNGGLHHVIDIGGGTTEVSVIDLVMDPTPAVDCRSDASRAVGSIRLKSFDLSRSGDDPAVEIYRHANSVWHDAYRLDAKNRARREIWKSLTVLIAGGGWGAGRVQQLLDKHHAAREYFHLDHNFALRFAFYSPSREVLRVGPSAGSGVDSSDSRHLLPVALGLSFYPSWPDWYKPSEAEPALPDPEDIIPDDPFYGHS